MKKSIKILPGHPFLLRPQLSQLSFRTPTVIEKFSGARPWYILDHRSIFGYYWPIAHGRNESHETNQAINSLSASLIHRARTRAPLTSLVQFWLQNCKTQQVFHKVREHRHQFKMIKMYHKSLCHRSWRWGTNTSTRHDLSWGRSNHPMALSRQIS